MQQRVEVEQQLTDAPEGHAVVFHTNRDPTDPVDSHKLIIAYHGEISQFYELCKSTAEWKELFGDWLFHWGKLPSVDPCNNSRYEEMYDTVHIAINELQPVSEDASFLGLKTIMSSGVFKTLSAFKAAIRAITTLEHDTQSPAPPWQCKQTRLIWRC